MESSEKNPEPKRESTTGSESPVRSQGESALTDKRAEQHETPTSGSRPQRASVSKSPASATTPPGDPDVRGGGTHATSMSDGELHAWHQIHTRDMWRIFRIMSEFVDGFDKLSRLGPCVSVFGSARTTPDHPYYRLGEQVGRRLVERDYGVITGGGPGIMEAANKGARDAGGMSIGLNIVVPHEQEGNPYVDRDKSIDFNFFFVRKVMFVKYAMGFIVLPGGYGTMDELFESLTLIQTGKSTRFPVVLLGREFWGGLVKWLTESVLSAGHISARDPSLFTLTDDPTEAVEIIDAFYREHAMVPNF